MAAEEEEGAGGPGDVEDDEEERLRIRIPAPGLMFGGAGTPGRFLPSLASVGAGDDDGGDRDPSGGGSGSGSNHSSLRGSSSGGAGGMGTTSLVVRYRWAPGVCSVCLCPYHAGESVSWSSNPSCEHCFHSACIEQWLLRQQNLRDGPLCPVCRRDFLVDPYDDNLDFDSGRGDPAAAAASSAAALDGSAGSEASRSRFPQPAPGGNDEGSDEEAGVRSEPPPQQQQPQQQQRRPFVLVWDRPGDE
jgi:hypothetical protein